MLKRVSITSFIFSIITIGGLYFVSLIKPITSLGVVISVLLVINFYLVVLRFYTNNYGLSCIASIIFWVFLFGMLAETEIMEITISALQIVFHLILAIIQVMVARKQSEIYEEERYMELEKELEEEFGLNER